MVLGLRPVEYRVLIVTPVIPRFFEVARVAIDVFSARSGRLPCQAGGKTLL